MGIPKVRREREGRSPNIPRAFLPSPLLQASLCSQTLGCHHRGCFLQFSPCHPSTSATPQWLGDPELNSGQDCASSVLREGWSEL